MRTHCRSLPSPFMDGIIRSVGFRSHDLCHKHQSIHQVSCQFLLIYFHRHKAFCHLGLHRNAPVPKIVSGNLVGNLRRVDVEDKTIQSLPRGVIFWCEPALGGIPGTVLGAGEDAIAPFATPKDNIIISCLTVSKTVPTGVAQMDLVIVATARLQRAGLKLLLETLFVALSLQSAIIGAPVAKRTSSTFTRLIPWNYVTHPVPPLISAPQYPKVFN